MTVKLEDFLYSPPAGFRNHGECELLEDAVITLLVSIAKIGPRHGFADAEMVLYVISYGGLRLSLTYSKMIEIP